MKNQKPYKSDRPRPFARPAAKPHRDEAKPAYGDKPKARLGRDGKPRREGEDAPRRGGGNDGKPAYRDRPSYGDKPRFGASAKPFRKSRDEDTVRLPGDARPRHADKARTKFKSDDGKPRRVEGGGSKPFYKPKEQSAFRADKPKFGRGAAKPARAAPARGTFTPAPGSILIWGLHAARAAWLNPKRRVTRAWLTEAGQKSFEAAQKQGGEELLKRPDAKRVERDELDRMTPPSSVHQGIVVECMPLHEPSLQDVVGMDPPPSLILMLDQVTDPHNVGAILRSAAAFGAGAVILTERNAPTTTGVLAKSASGALEHVPMVHVVNLARAIDDLREAGYWCVGLAEEGAKTLGEHDMSGRTVLILGAEGEGLRHLTRQKCDELARLPTGGPVGSLNVSNAAAVALYEAKRQGK